MTKEIQARISMLDAQILQAKACADYWIAMATTGIAKTQNIENLATGQLTDEQKVKDALKIALSHIDHIDKLANSRYHLILGERI